MRIVIIALLAAGGCASSYSIEQGAREHQQKAQMFEAQGDYHRAARENAAAQKQFAKARQRAYEESYWW